MRGLKHFQAAEGKSINNNNNNNNNNNLLFNEGNSNYLIMTQ